jgi:hypothetical protein
LLKQYEDLFIFSFFPHDTQWESQEKTKRIGIWKSLWVSTKKRRRG